jgi:hypothetical protein
MKRAERLRLVKTAPVHAVIEIAPLRLVGSHAKSAGLIAMEITVKHGVIIVTEDVTIQVDLTRREQFRLVLTVL